MRAPCKELSPFSARASLDTCGVGAVLGERVLSLAVLGLYKNMAGGCARVGHVGEAGRVRAGGQNQSRKQGLVY